MEFWGQFSSSNFGTIPSDWSYDTCIMRLIGFADGEIDNFCMVPHGFFTAGGVVVSEEYHDGKHVASGNRPLLSPDYTPVLDVHKLEFYEGGAWVEKTEGMTGDFTVTPQGFILRALPDRTDYGNIRLTYQCGYKETPAEVVTVSGRVAAAVGQLIIDADKRVGATTQGQTVTVPELASLAKVAFTPELQAKLKQFRLQQVQVYRG